MATALEQAFTKAVIAAAGVREAAYAAAFATYAPNGFGVFANLAAYQAALVAADNAFYSSVQTAATTNVISPAVAASMLASYAAGPSAAILT